MNIVPARAMPELRTVRDHDAKGDGELLQSDQGTTGLGRGQFGIVQRHEQAEGTDSQTRNEASSKDVVFAVEGRGGLDDDAGAEDGGGDDDADTAADGVGQPSVEKHANPGAEFEDGGEEATGGVGAVAVEGFEAGLEGGHGQDLTEHALVV